MSPLSIRLPEAGGRLVQHALHAASPHIVATRPRASSRRVLAAAHVVADPLADANPVLGPAVDWDATLRYRHHLWDQGLGVAEAMDTAQRGGGLPFALVEPLIRRSLTEASARGATVACGVATDALPWPGSSDLPTIIGAYDRQCELVESCGGQVVLMASRQLAACAQGPADYEHVYGRVLEALQEPAILHWLGTPFDPALAGYWGHADTYEAMGVLVGIIKAHASKVDGVKLSLLDPEAELELRRRLPAGIHLYTGDDFNYPTMIQGDADGHSDALLGVFDAIAPLASAALVRLDAGDADAFEEILNPTLPLGRKLFEAPTYHYKTGVVFLAYLRGFQEHFHMLGGSQGTRSVLHLSSLFRLADEVGLFTDPEDAVRRMVRFLELAGVTQ